MKPSLDLSGLSFTALYELAYAASDDATEFQTRVDGILEDSHLSDDEKEEAISIFIKEKAEQNPCTSIIIESLIGSCEIY